MSNKVIDLEQDINALNNINLTTLQKMLFIFNSVEQGWIVRKKGECYVFRKKHGEKKEYLSEDFLIDFIRKHTDMKGILKKLSDETTE